MGPEHGFLTRLARLWIMRAIRKEWILLAVWMSVIFGTSCRFISSEELSKAVSTHGPIAISPSSFDRFWDSYWWVFVKGYHVLEFALLAVLLLKPLRFKLPFVASFALLYAASDEFHQTFVPGRGGRVSDVIIDAIGISAVCLVVRFVRKRQASLHQPKPSYSIQQ